jgi:hypothetical protein
VFTALLRRNERGADHIKRRSSIVERVRFRGNVFTKPLPSNELFRISGVISQYISRVYERGRVPKLVWKLYRRNKFVSSAEN